MCRLRHTVAKTADKTNKPPGRLGVGYRLPLAPPMRQPDRASVSSRATSGDASMIIDPASGGARNSAIAKQPRIA